MIDSSYQKFVKRWEEVTELPPQTLGPFTSLYKSVVPRLKVMPWPWLILVSIFAVSALFLLTRFTVTGAATILQRGF